MGNLLGYGDTSQTIPKIPKTNKYRTSRKISISSRKSLGVSERNKSSRVSVRPEGYKYDIPLRQVSSKFLNQSPEFTGRILSSNSPSSR